jgi:GLPGLI family protein
MIQQNKKMKNIHTFLILFIVKLTFSQTNGKINYIINFNKPKIELKKNQAKIAMRLIKEAKAISATLLFNQNESVYQIDSKMKVDSNKEFNITQAFADDGDVFYSNVFTQKQIKKTNYGDKEYIISIEKQNWNLIQETKKIGKYLCYKAIIDIKNDLVIAWYTNEIPLNFGPNKFNGLPGLILELQTKTLHYSLNKLSLNIKEGVKIKKQNYDSAITEEEFKKIVSQNSVFNRN